MHLVVVEAAGSSVCLPCVLPCRVQNQVASTPVIRPHCSPCHHFSLSFLHSRQHDATFQHSNLVTAAQTSTVLRWLTADYIKVTRIRSDPVTCRHGPPRFASRRRAAARWRQKAGVEIVKKVLWLKVYVTVITAWQFTTAAFKNDQYLFLVRPPIYRRFHRGTHFLV